MNFARNSPHSVKPKYTLTTAYHSQTKNTTRSNDRASFARSSGVLGHNTVVTSPNEKKSLRVPFGFISHSQKSTTPNRYRYDLLKGAKKIIGESGSKHRMLYCSAHVAHDKSHARVISSGENHAALADVGVCENSWCCPVCAARLGQEYATEIRRIMQATATTHRVFMVTYTARHDKSMTLEQFANAFKNARQQMKSGKAWQDLSKAFGIEYTIRSDECTYGAAGWHFHSHELIFFRRDAEKKAMAAANAQYALGKLWMKKLAKNGLTAEFDIALKATEAKAEIANYINKIGDITPVDIPSEVARHDTKHAYNNRSIMELLHDATYNDDKVAAARWIEFLTWSKRKKRVSFCRALEVLRDELATVEGESSEPETLLLLDQEELRFLWRFGAVGAMLQIASNRDKPKLLKWLDDLKWRHGYVSINLSLLD